jgi:benzoylformate decarboxylase
MLGFALPAAIGLRMARPDRPVLAVVGDGSSLYQIQALWSAVAYDVGVLFIVLRNGGYAIMDRLAERSGAAGPWPSLERIDIAGLARAQGCEARRIETHDELLDALDEGFDRATPLVLEVVVAQDDAFDL